MTPYIGLVVAHHIGGRCERAARKFWKKIPPKLRTCNFETDHWKAHRKIISSSQHKVGKDLTFYIEGFNATIRARVSRLELFGNFIRKNNDSPSKQKIKAGASC